MHQHQLNRLTSLTEELVKTLQGAEVYSADSMTTSPSSVNPRLAFPKKFDGGQAKCKGFLLQCSMFVNQQPTLYPTDSSRVAFVCSLLTGRTLDWATALCRYSFSASKYLYEHLADGKSPGDQLLVLCQRKTTAAEYPLTF